MYNILFFGKLPPPFIGPAVATQIILNSKLSYKFNLIHFNTSHHKNINQLSKNSFKNIIYPFIQYFRLIYCLIFNSIDAVYIPSQQSTIGYLRDIPYLVISKIFRKKVICHLRGGYFKNWYDESNILVQFIISNVQKFVDGQIVLGENLRYLYSFLMPKEKIFVIPNGADFPQLKKDSSNKNFNVLFLGNFIKSKGLIDVLNSAIILKKKEVSNIKFNFAGNWMEEQTKNKFYEIKDNEKLNNIEMLGQITGNKKYKLLTEMDIFVFPTYYRNEGHPWVIVEALAAGLPIISTDHGAIVESVIDGYNGFIVQSHSPEQIAEKLNILINNKELREKMGANSRKHYEENFTEDILVKNFTHVFNSVLNK